MGRGGSGGERRARRGEDGEGGRRRVGSARRRTWRDDVEKKKIRIYKKT